MFDFFSKKEPPKNLKAVLSDLAKLEKKTEVLDDKLKELEKKSQFPIQKAGVIRYNPFEGIGGDQSFSVALLDGNNDGFVISSIYSREGNRVYAKPIKSGSSEYPLSEEEKKAIESAIDSKNPKS